MLTQSLKSVVVCLGFFVFCVSAGRCLAAEAVSGTIVTTNHDRIVVDLAGTWQGRTIDGLKLTEPAASERNGDWKDIRIPQTWPRADDRTLLIEGSPYEPSMSEVLTPDGKRISPESGWGKKAAAWFRRSFRVDAKWLLNHRAVLYIGGAGPRHKIWLNGQLVGESMIGLVPAEYDVTRLLHPDDNNELVIAAGNAATLVDVANRTLLAPVSGAYAGVWGSVELRFLPPVYVRDVFVITNVTDKRLDVQVTLENTSASAATIDLHGRVTDDRGEEMTSLDDQTATIPAGQQTVVKMSKAWIAPVLWSPASPVLYRLTVGASADGREVDQTQLRFGFRQFDIRGRDFYLNGKHVVLLRHSYYSPLGFDQQEALKLARGDADQPFNCWRLQYGFVSEAMLDAADQIGLLTMPESSWNSVNGRFSLEHADLWLPNVTAYTQALIRLHRNHPSVILWNLTNETMWNRIDNLRMNIAQQVLDAAKQADSTRPFGADGDNTWDGRLSVINIHYPEGEMQTTLARQYPNAGLLYPNMFHWLHDKGMNHAGRGDFEWDRPLIVGEYWDVMENDPVPLSSFCGEAVFDWERRRYDDFVGRDDQPQDPLLWAVKGMTDAYRMQGVAGLNPWYGDRSQVMPDIAVRPVDYCPNFFGGRTAVRKVVVFNQTPNEYNYMHLQCRLMVGQQTIWAGDVNSVVPPGETKTFEIPMAVPGVESPTSARLIVRLVHERGRNWLELSRYEETIYLLPQPSLADLNATGLLIVQHDAELSDALAKFGLTVAAREQLTAADLAAARIVLLGPKVDTKGLQTALVDFIKAGGRVIQFESTSDQSITPSAPVPDSLHAATRAWMLAPHHPILDGLSDGMFSFWRPDNLVTTGTLRKLPGSPAKYLLESGGRFGMAWTPLAEVPMGKGTLLLCQMPLLERIDIEPAAGVLLARIIRYASQFTPTPTHPLVVLAPPSHKGFDALAAANVAITTQLAYGDEPVLIFAGFAPTVQQITQLKQRLAAGGTIWLSGFDPKTIDTVASLLPFQPQFVPFDAKKTQGAVVRSTDPLIANISAQEMAWYHYSPVRGDYFAGSKPTATLGRWVLQPPTLEAAQKLVEPGLLYKVSVGRGTILIDTLEWPAAFATEHDKVTQLIGSLAMNIGAAIEPNSDAQKYVYFPLDLSKQANMGFYDPASNDGKGGWTDQGRNDMRFFLINHVGRQGGLESGMELPLEAMPEQVVFLGRTFAIVDPKKNNGKSVISLRGGAHGSLLSSQVNGIPVNRRADRLWFLQDAGWLGPVGQTIAKYVIHYDDGSSEEFTIRSGIEVGDWWDPVPHPQAQVAWTGRNLEHAPVGMYQTSWINPHPEQLIRSIDVVGDQSSAQFVVVAITAGVRKVN